MLSQADFSNQLTPFTKKAIATTINDRYERLINEVTNSSCAAKINHSTALINDTALKSDVWERHLKPLYSEYPRMIAIIKTMFDVDFLDAYLIEHTLPYFLALINDIFHRYRDLDITGVTQRSKSFIFLSNTIEEVDLARIKRKLHSIIVEVLTKVHGTYQRLDYRKMLHEIFDLKFDEKDQIINLVEGRFGLDTREWLFLTDILKVIFDIEKSEFNLRNNIVNLRADLLAKNDLPSLLNATKNYISSDSLPLTIKHFFTKGFLRTPQANIRVLASLWNYPIEAFFELRQNYFNCNKFLIYRLKERLMLEENCINQLSIHNFVKTLHQAILHASNLYNWKNVNDGTLLYYYHHGFKGWLEVRRLNDFFNDPNHSDLSKIKYLATFLDRHKSKSGLRMHSFDTLLLSILHNNSTQASLYRFSFLAHKKPMADLPKPELADSKNLKIQGFVPGLLRGKERLKLRADRHVVRTGAKHLLFALDSSLTDVQRPLTRMGSLTRLR